MQPWDLRNLEPSTNVDVAGISLSSSTLAGSFVYMRNIFAASLLLFIAGPGHAQTFKVIRAKGNRAVIQLPKGTTLEKDRTYNVAEGDGGSEEGLVEGSGGDRRGKSIMIAPGKLIMGSGKTSPGGVKTSATTIDFEARYGINSGKAEYGPIGGFTYDSTAVAGLKVTNTAFRIGGYYDFNLVPNLPTARTVYGLTAMGTYGVLSTATSGTSTSASEINIGAGGQLKWFPFGHSASLRAESRLDYYRTSVSAKGASAASTTTMMNWVVLGGLQVYF